MRKTKSFTIAKSILFTCMWLMAFSMFAQNVTVRGTVIDAGSEPVIGVTVMVQGTSSGTVTDIDGNYTLSNVSPNATLQFSYVGMKSQNVAVNGRTTVNVTMESDTELLDEVVVVGYGTQKKVNLTGSVATIDNKLLEGRPMTNVSAGLAGLLPGVSVRQSSGLPGGDNGTIRVRGLGTLNNANPMVIIDGVEASMTQVNAEDIANISVLKDAASAAIYGSKAANGVILISTKSGKSGKPMLSYTGDFGWQSATRLPEYLGSADYAELYNEALLLGGKAKRFSDEDIKKFRDGSSPYTHPNTDWLGLLYAGSGFQTSHNVALSGGSEYATYRTSLNYQKQEGIIKFTGKERYNARTNVTMKPTKWLTSNVNLSYTRETLEEPNNAYVGGGLDQIIRQVSRIAPWIPYKNEDGSYGTISDGNPIAWIDQGAQIKTKKNYFLGIGSLEFALMEGLTLKGVASIDMYIEDKASLNKEIQYNANKYHGPTKLEQIHRNSERVAGDVLLNYNKSFGVHSLALMGGYHAETYNLKRTLGYRENFPSTELSDLNGGSTKGMKAEGFTRQLNMVSWFGRINYDLMNRYLFEANLRYDASSRFAPDYRWGAFPSVSAGWRISEETFMENTKSVLDNLKIRASWGILGNQDALTDGGESVYYPTVPTLSLGQDYPLGGSVNSGAAIVDAKNQKLRWEKTASWGVGVDVTLLRKLNLTIDYYNRTTSDIIMEVPSPETFALKKYYDNVGSVSNKGIEVSMQYNNRFNQVDFGIGGNFSYNKNKLIELAGQKEIISGRKIRRIGESIDAFYGYKTDGLYQSTQDIQSWAANKLFNTGSILPGDLRYVDTTGDKEVTSADRVVLGNSSPSFIYGFNLTAAYKGFDLLAIFQGTLGGNGYMDFDAVGSTNGDSQKPAKMWKDRWNENNKNTTVPRVIANIYGPSMPQNNTLEYWMRSSNYLRLKNLQIGYNVPKNVLGNTGINKVRIYYSGQNMLTLTKFLKGWDPEAPDGRGSGYPVVMVNSIGLNITF